ncbi:MAG TPA: ribonuclease Z [archaeon]|nr:ribonuclease Z [archaeon]
MIEITFLGTVSGIPSKNRNHPAIALEYFGEEKDTLLFDCGEGTQKQLMIAGISFMKIDKIFISHWHADHFAGLIPLIQTMNLEKRTKELKIFAPEAEKFVSNILSLGYFGCRFPITAINLPYEGDRLKLIDEAQEYEILSIPVFHSVPTVAFAFKEKDRWGIDLEKLKKLGLKRGYWLKKLKRLGKAAYKGKEVSIEQVANLKPGLKVVYSGDTKPCDNMVKISENSDLLIHDGTFLEEEEGKSHADVKEAAKIAKKSNVKELILTHVSRRYTSPKELEDEAKKIFENTRVAHDFMKVKLKD